MNPRHPDGQLLRVALLVNTHSRKGRRLYRHAKTMLEARGYHFIKAVALANPTTIAQVMADIMALKPELLIVGGGDGTISTACNYLAYTDTVLGYLPLGTTNNFGRSLGLRPRLTQAIDTICHGTPSAIDLGKIGDTYFTNMVSFGVSVQVAHDTPRHLKRLLGRPIYALYAAASTLRHRPITVTITTETEERVFHTHQFCIANGTIHSGIPIAADASVIDHQLIAYALGGKSHLSTLGATFWHGLTAHKKMAEKDLLVSPHFTITFDPPQKIDRDGEVAPQAAKASYSVASAPAALNVLVPARSSCL